MRAFKPFLFALAILACGPSVGAGPPEEEIRFAGSEAALDGAAAPAPFDFLALRDLWVRIKVRKPARFMTLTLTFLSPGGTPFYEAIVLYTTDPTVRVGQVNGAPASALQGKHMPGGFFALDYPVPIDGSVFQRYPEPGTWLVKAQVDSTGTSLSMPLDVVYGGRP